MTVLPEAVDMLLREVYLLRGQVELLESALRHACTPPWPRWSTVDETSTVALMEFHLRNARAAGGDDE